MMAETHSRNIIPDLTVYLVSFLMAFPLFILAHRKLPDFDWPYQLDRILLFTCIIFLLLVILRMFRVVVLVLTIGLLAWLGWGSVSGGYGFMELFRDYRAVIYSVENDPVPEGILLAGRTGFSARKEIREAIVYDDPEVRDFAVEAASNTFRREQKQYPEYRNLIQCFAVFKKINSNWNYVNDPTGGEYFASARESVHLLAGDCDDHTILMAAAIKAIGGTTRLVRTSNHIYPELLVGSQEDLSQVSQLIKKSLFAVASRGQDIHYHRDSKGQVWINLDYTAACPGGPFMQESIVDMMYP